MGSAKFLPSWVKENLKKQQAMVDADRENARASASRPSVISLFFLSVLEIHDLNT